MYLFWHCYLNFCEVIGLFIYFAAKWWIFFFFTWGGKYHQEPLNTVFWIWKPEWGTHSILNTFLVGKFVNSIKGPQLKWICYLLLKNNFSALLTTSGIILFCMVCYVECCKCLLIIWLTSVKYNLIIHANSFK